ncbi:hypothetical protein GGS23DRAFT_76629 [Durotheca rogersii]|uniref:uncharacterized protein n=1 Tax=Durotheca rogersii TaxID=419775 RepID=UPI0022209949|nr:uncharacterized protein GGS23DRAFT_76629 [Durotheca rogersii]KAI5862949.1 hypothetical protein GGS23DRAFT_76629 [Durotheca rogersii]
MSGVSPSTRHATAHQRLHTHTHTYTHPYTHSYTHTYTLPAIPAVAHCKQAAVRHARIGMYVGRGETRSRKITHPDRQTNGATLARVAASVLWILTYSAASPQHPTRGISKHPVVSRPTASSQPSVAWNLIRREQRLGLIARAPARAEVSPPLLPGKAGAASASSQRCAAPLPTGERQGAPQATRAGAAPSTAMPWAERALAPPPAGLRGVPRCAAVATPPVSLPTSGTGKPVRRAANAVPPDARGVGRGLGALAYLPGRATCPLARAQEAGDDLWGGGGGWPTTGER